MRHGLIQQICSNLIVKDAEMISNDLIVNLNTFGELIQYFYLRVNRYLHICYKICFSIITVTLIRLRPTGKKSYRAFHLFLKT